MCKADPTHIQRLLVTLVRWETHADSRSKPLRDQWMQTLKEQDWAQATEESERGNQLRQASPMAVILPTDVRLKIIRDVRQLKSSLHPQTFNN